MHLPLLLLVVLQDDPYFLHPVLHNLVLESQYLPSTQLSLYVLQYLGFGGGAGGVEQVWLIHFVFLSVLSLQSLSPLHPVVHVPVVDIADDALQYFPVGHVSVPVVEHVVVVGVAHWWSELHFFPPVQSASPLHPDVHVPAVDIADDALQYVPVAHTSFVVTHAIAGATHVVPVLGHTPIVALGPEPSRQGSPGAECVQLLGTQVPAVLLPTHVPLKPVQAAADSEFVHLSRQKLLEPTVAQVSGKVRKLGQECVLSQCLHVPLVPAALQTPRE